MITAGTEHLTSDEFIDALADAEPGCAVNYAIGDLAFSASASAELALLRGLAWKRYVAGLGYLTQRRRGVRLFEYIFTVATPRRKSEVARS